MTTTSPPRMREQLTPHQSALALLLKDIHRSDDACGRAVDRLLAMKDLPPLVSFDGVEARFQSESEPELENVVTPEGCSCRGGNHPWCVHRVRYRVLIAEAALRDPLSLVSAFLEQLPESMRRPRPYPWPAPDPRRAGMPEAELPGSLLGHAEPPPPDDADRRGTGRRPSPRVTPIDPRVQREIDELFPL